MLNDIIDRDALGICDCSGLGIDFIDEIQSKPGKRGEGSVSPAILVRKVRVGHETVEGVEVVRLECAEADRDTRRVCAGKEINSVQQRMESFVAENNISVRRLRNFTADC